MQQLQKFRNEFLILLFKPVLSLLKVVTSYSCFLLLEQGFIYNNYTVLITSLKLQVAVNCVSTVFYPYLLQLIKKMLNNSIV